MQVRNHGKYTRMRLRNPRAIAVCDYSGLYVQHAALRRQMEYRGSGLVWTGYYVNPQFLDVPNPQNLTPLIYVDPKPILNARPDGQLDPITLNLDVSGGLDISLTPTQFSNIYFVFTGVLTADVTLIVPSTFNEFYVTNNTTGFRLFMQIYDNLQTQIELPRDKQSFILNDCFTLRFINPN